MSKLAPSGAEITGRWIPPMEVASLGTSLHPVSTRRPSGEKATLVTPPESAAKLRTSRPVSASQSLADPR